jgi:gluconolactonase
MAGASIDWAQAEAAPLTELASGLRFPEGPIALPDGDLLLVEIARGTLTRVARDGQISVVAELGGGPNGAAIGPDGHCYVCNNGGFRWVEDAHGLRPHGQSADYRHGSIQRVDLATGRYTEVNGRPLRGPNDLVFDRQGGFWFTDNGKGRDRDLDRGGVYYAKADGSFIAEVIYPMLTPNGVGLSPDERTLYVAETHTGRIWAFEVDAPGQVRKRPFPSPAGGTLLAGLGGFQLLDSLAVDSAGNVCVATLYNGGITAVSPEGRVLRHLPLPDLFITNVCFGGPGLRTAYATLSHSGRLVSFPWPLAGLPLNFLNT